MKPQKHTQKTCVSFTPKNAHQRQQETSRNNKQHKRTHKNKTKIIKNKKQQTKSIQKNGGNTKTHKKRICSIRGFRILGELRPLLPVVQILTEQRRPKRLKKTNK